MGLQNKANNSYAFLYGKDLFEFKPGNENDKFATQFFLGSIPNRFSTTESREVSLKGNIYDFSVDQSSIDKSDMSNILRYVMVKKNTT